jgi:hypothetical protein
LLCVAVSLATDGKISGRLALALNRSIKKFVAHPQECRNDSNLGCHVLLSVILITPYPGRIE